MGEKDNETLKAGHLRVKNRELIYQAIQSIRFEVEYFRSRLDSFTHDLNKIEERLLTILKEFEETP